MWKGLVDVLGCGGFIGPVHVSGAQIVNVTTSTTNNLIKVWCVEDQAGEVRVTVIHKDLTATANATYVMVPAIV